MHHIRQESQANKRDDLLLTVKRNKRHQYLTSGQSKYIPIVKYANGSFYEKGTLRVRDMKGNKLKVEML